MTTTLSGEQYPTLGWLLPLVAGLRRTLEPLDTDTLVISDLKEKLQEQLTERFKLDDLEPNSLPVLAAALDPRFRNLIFLTAEQKTEVKEALVTRATSDI